MTGNFGPGTAGMTLQQAVFAGLVDPGQLVNVREIIEDTRAMRHGRHRDGRRLRRRRPHHAHGGDHRDANCDTALFSKPVDQYTINRNTDGSVTVAFTPIAGGPAVAGGEPRRGAAVRQGRRHRHAVEHREPAVLHGNDPVTKACNAFDDHLLSEFPITTPVTANLSPTSLSFVSPTGVGVGHPVGHDHQHRHRHAERQRRAGDRTGRRAVHGDQQLHRPVRNRSGHLARSTSSSRRPATGPETAELDINTNADGLTHVVTLTGTIGTPPAGRAGCTDRGDRRRRRCFGSGQLHGRRAMAARRSPFTVQPMVDGVPVRL